ncbi:MAG: T9SS type A sorting domain-containing protein, partial [Bacteroidota bacterium]
ATVSADEGDTYFAELEDIIAIEITDIANSTRELPNEVDIKVYPNPAKDVVNLEYIGQSVDILEIEFRNSLGQIVKSLEMKPFANQKARQIDISNLPTGIYNIAIKQGERRTVKKLLVD